MMHVGCGDVRTVSIQLWLRADLGNKADYPGRLPIAMARCPRRSLN